MYLYTTLYKYGQPHQPLRPSLDGAKWVFEYYVIQTRAQSSLQTLGRWPFRKSFGDPGDGSLDQFNPFNAVLYRRRRDLGGPVSEVADTLQLAKTGDIPRSSSRPRPRIEESLQDAVGPNPRSLLDWGRCVVLLIFLASSTLVYVRTSCLGGQTASAQIGSSALHAPWHFRKPSSPPARPNRLVPAGLPLGGRLQLGLLDTSNPPA